MEKGLGHYLSWALGEEYTEGCAPEIDRIIMFFPKALFLSVRRTAKILLGQDRRDRIRFLQQFWFAEFESPSYHMLRLCYRRSKNKLLKVRVSKYGFSYLCRINSGDFTPQRESEVLKLFTPSKGDIVVDIGAHIGRYTMISSRAVGPSGRVIAVEADPDNFEMLNCNIELNEIANVLPLRCAAYSTNTKLRLYKVTSSEIYNTVMPSRAHNKSNYLDVDAFTLDEILQSNHVTRVDWLKIDVEGAEFEVLKGAKQTLADNSSLSILVEVHNIEDPKHYERIAAFLQSFGFSSDFELTYSNSERHVIFRRQRKLARHPT